MLSTYMTAMNNFDGVLNILKNGKGNEVFDKETRLVVHEIAKDIVRYTKEIALSSLKWSDEENKLVFACKLGETAQYTIDEIDKLSSQIL